MEGVAVLGGGCFWCIEAVFQRVKGVNKILSGYAGGETKNPTYIDICRGDTNHAEVVKVFFNMAQISFENLLRIFFIIHDPTTSNRQGADIGTQYRSVIFYQDTTQKKQAEAVIKKMQKYFDSKIVTELNSNPIFYPAENYHQNYYNDNTQKGYCQVVINPKIVKLKKEFQDFYIEN